MRRVSVGVVFVALLASVGPAAAQDPDVPPDDDVTAREGDAERTALARSLFLEGVEHANAGRFEEAADRFRRAGEIRPSAGISYNLAAALARLGQVVDAGEVLRDVLEAEDASEALRQQALDLMEQVTQRRGRLTLRITGGEDAELRIDGRRLSRAAVGVAMPVDPGEHVIEAHRAGEVVASVSVTVAEGASAEATLEVPEPDGSTAPPVPVVPEPTEPVPEDQDEGGTIFGEWWFWTALLVVAGGAVVGGLWLSGFFDQETITGNAMPGVLEWD